MNFFRAFAEFDWIAWIAESLCDEFALLRDIIASSEDERHFAKSLENVEMAIAGRSKSHLRSTKYNPVTCF
jgi:hypothetical protein